MFPTDRDPRIARMEFELRATGVKPEASNPLRSGVHTRGYLPHVKREGPGLSGTQQSATLRYSRVQLCATAAGRRGRRDLRISSFAFHSDFVIRHSSFAALRSFPREALGLADHPLQLLGARIGAVNLRHTGQVSEQAVGRN